MLQQIKYFQAVVQNNSLSEAAEECHISQSAISQQIKALEQALGFPLLERKNRRFSLTPAGEYFYRKSLILVADYEQLCREAVGLSMKCYRKGKEFKTCLGERQLRGRIGKLLYARSLMASCFLKSSKE